MMKGKKGNDSKYFSTTKKGEIRELQDELGNQDREKKKDAVKKVIAAMTVGKDVSMLFTHVVNCIQTADVELKKLVYLYLMNYAKSNPDLAILAVNTFVKDAADQNPLIRALAVRTMGCIRVDRIVEYLCEPLRKCLRDEDPYVRKTAAICVAKMFDINADMVVDQGFLDALRDLISDSNPTVVANAVAAADSDAAVSKKHFAFLLLNHWSRVSDSSEPQVPGHTRVSFVARDAIRHDLCTCLTNAFQMHYQGMLSTPDVSGAKESLALHFPGALFCCQECWLSS